MWVFTTAGFVSAVEDREDSTRVVVRSRDRESLETVAAGIEVTYGESDLVENILVDAGTDYQYRVSVLKVDFGNYLLHEVLNYLDYSNFKNALEDSRGPEWASTALEVWGAVREISDHD